MSGVVIREVWAGCGLERAVAVRCAVFVAEQGLSEAQEIDGLDGQARHLLALRDGRPLGALRLRFLDEGLGAGRVVKIERVAVLAAARRQQVGRALLGAALALAGAAGATEARLHAQTTVLGFYARQGFVAYGTEFEEDGILHVAMRLALPADRTPEVSSP